MGYKPPPRPRPSFVTPEEVDRLREEVLKIDFSPERPLSEVWPWNKLLHDPPAVRPRTPSFGEVFEGVADALVDVRDLTCELFGRQREETKYDYLGHPVLAPRRKPWYDRWRTWPFFPIHGQASRSQPAPARLQGVDGAVGPSEPSAYTGATGTCLGATGASGTFKRGRDTDSAGPG